MSIKRANTTGSIYPIAGGGYMAQIYTPHGKKKRARAANHKDAIAALKRLQQEADFGRFDHVRSGKLSDFVETWLQAKAAMLEPKTLTTYAWVLRDHVLPTLGKKQLDKVKRHDVQALVSALSVRTVKPRGKQPNQSAPAKLLNRRTMAMAVSVLHNVYQDAIKGEYCSVNPAAMIDLPRQTKKADTQSPMFLNPEQARALLGALADSPVRSIVLFMLSTGARQSEARGIRWHDVDIQAGTVRIAGQLKRVDGVLQYVAGTKTNQDRVLPISAAVRQDLEDLNARRLVEGIDDPDGLVFLNPYGRRIDQKYLYEHLGKACDGAGIPRVSPHKTRHTAATLALMDGASLHAVQKMLGHQQQSLTADLYGHLVTEGLRPVADALGRIYAPLDDEG
ncbi:MAG: tyrosine-type recombinase/integrase [Fimbriimonadales bacterium]